MAKKSESTNAIDAQKARLHLQNCLKIYEDLKAEQMAYMGRCKAIRDRLPELYDRAKDDGIPVRALKAQIKIKLEDVKIEQAKARQLAAMPEDREEKELFDQLVAALGDFASMPLGEAAVEKAAPKEDADNVRDLRPRHLVEAEKQRAENAKNLRGIGKLETPSSP